MQVAEFFYFVLRFTKLNDRLLQLYMLVIIKLDLQNLLLARKLFPYKCAFCF